MTMTLELPDELEQRVSLEAARLGVAAEEHALRVLAENAPPMRSAAARLIESWITDGDAEEQRETGDYLVGALDEDRLSGRKLFP